MFRTLISRLATRHASQRESQDETARQACTMEPMEGRILMAFNNFMRLEGVGGGETAIGSTVTFTYTVSNPTPTSGILIGLLLPAVQRA